jgi:hypothetical protein
MSETTLRNLTDIFYMLFYNQKGGYHVEILFCCDCGDPPDPFRIILGSPHSRKMPYGNVSLPVHLHRDRGGKPCRDPGGLPLAPCDIVRKTQQKGVATATPFCCVAYRRGRCSNRSRYVGRENLSTETNYDIGLSAYSKNRSRK